MNLYEEWMALRANEKGLHGLELSNRLGVSECELYASAVGKTAGDVSSTRLVADWKDLLRRLPQLGKVKARVSLAQRTATLQRMRLSTCVL